MSALRPITFLLATLVCGVALAQGFKPPPAPQRWVTDTAGFLSPQTQRSLDARLENYERTTGRQVVVWIGRDLGGVTIEDWAVRTFEAWGIGRKGKDDGVALFVFANDRKLRIEVGYGLEGDIPDAIAHRIIQENAIPYLRSNNPDTAITESVSAILERLGGETAPPPRANRPAAARERGTPWGSYFLIAVMILLFITHPRLAFFLLFSILSGGRGGGGGGGGFRGGGGRSGGGGASGSW